MLKYNRNNKSKACALRSHMTDAEQRLWSRLRRKQVIGVPFYRQKPIGEYIVDFHAPAAKLVIEVDGSQHLESRGRKRDERRDGDLQQMGLRVLRFDNLQVLQETDAVMEAIHSAVEMALTVKIPPRSPLFQRGDEIGRAAEDSTQPQASNHVHSPLCNRGDESRHTGEDGTQPHSSTTVHSPLCKRGARGDLTKAGEEAE
ncbi:MAG TPA: endonuclease domain-containing protein [Acidiferrobacterales bacterium]|nr:endonuclease domain-containing protein [Acidiferrobacterales bacterium]